MRPRTKFIFQIWFYFQNTLSGIMIYLCHSGLINPEITYFLDYLIQNYVFITLDNVLRKDQFPAQYIRFVIPKLILHCSGFIFT